MCFIAMFNGTYGAPGSEAFDCMERAIGAAQAAPFFLEGHRLYFRRRCEKVFALF